MKENALASREVQLLRLAEARSARVGGGDQTTAEIFATILTQGPLSRSDIARVTGLSQSTVTKAVQPMLAHGYVVEGTEAAQGRGRPAIPLRVNDERHFVAGAKITAHEAISVVIDPRARVLVSKRRRLRAKTPEGVVGELARSLKELLEESGHRDRVEGLGIGLGGHVDGREGVLRYSPILGWRDVPLAAILEEATGLFTVVENDVNALAVAEQLFGAGLGVANFAVVTLGTGIGCGIVLDGQLVHGATGLAGELGHIPIVTNGERCRCGNRGCVETVASERAILAAIGDREGQPVTSIAVAAELARHGDEPARAAFARAGAALGRALAALVGLVNPERIVLSGEGIVASDLLMDSLRSALARHAFSNAATECELLTRPLADETWARGAAANVLRHLISRPLRLPAVPT